MGLPRRYYVKEGQEGVYHCFSRCVRRAFLCGFDTLTHRDFSHRKAWLVDRLRHLASIFAIDVCAYAVMENHYHAILRTRPDIVAAWSDREVAIRWLTLSPPHRNPFHTHNSPTEIEICALTDCPDRIAQLRQRLCSLSWFMGKLNEFIARAANKEDNVKGRFWESRFQCQALLDDAAIATCMVYVDLNPIRAGLAPSPEQSNFTSIQERIRAWYAKTTAVTPVTSHPAQDKLSSPVSRNTSTQENVDKNTAPIPECISASEISTNSKDFSDCWLCPIHSEPGRRGILQITPAEYFYLVDGSARITRFDKQGAMDPNLMPILLRIGASPEKWPETISHFGSQFSLVAGLLSNLRNFADQLGKRWLKGFVAACAAFTSPQPQLADT
jgi:putative transposase